jgi:hypothetical protein
VICLKRATRQMMRQFRLPCGLCAFSLCPLWLKIWKMIMKDGIFSPEWCILNHVRHRSFILAQCHYFYT